MMFRPKNALFSTSAIAMPRTNFSAMATTVKISEFWIERKKRGDDTTCWKLASPMKVASRPIDLSVKEIQMAVPNGQTTRTAITIRTGASSSQPSAESRCQNGRPDTAARDCSRAVEMPEERVAIEVMPSAVLVLLVDLVDLFGRHLERFLGLLVVADDRLEHARDHVRRLHLGHRLVRDVRPVDRLARLRQLDADLQPGLVERLVVVVGLRRRSPLRLRPVVLVVLLVVQEEEEILRLVAEWAVGTDAHRDGADALHPHIRPGGNQVRAHTREHIRLVVANPGRDAQRVEGEDRAAGLEGVVVAGLVPGQDARREHLLVGEAVGDDLDDLDGFLLEVAEGRVLALIVGDAHAVRLQHVDPAVAVRGVAERLAQAERAGRPLRL